ncbi:MAG: hypothetical protein ACE5G2_00540 [Candidatus Krumholzibacteriia bacterium]
MRAVDLLKKFLAVGVPVAILAGCDLLTDSPDQTSSQGDSTWEESTDLTSEYGGYEFTDESAAFGDPELAKLEAEENIVVVADSDTVIENNSFALRILWGQLEGNPEAEDVIDWSGSISVSSGAVAVLRTIAFERPTDHLLPRENRQVVGFRSITRPHFDGLLLVIKDDSDAAATLTFDTGPYAGSWTLSELREINEVIAVDDLGNEVSLTGMPLRNDPACPSGFVRGHWMVREGERGFFRGLWIAEYGRPVGHIRGHFGVNDEGMRVWFGKIIGRGGRIIGLARGTFEPSEDPEHPGGTFRGHWAARPGERAGVVGGHYVPVREGERGAVGFFQGRWKTDCGDADGDNPETP